MAQEAGQGRMMSMIPHGEFSRSAAGYKALQRITVAIRSHVDLGRVLDILAADTGRFLDLGLCSIARWDREGRGLVFSSEYRREPDQAPYLTLQGRRFEPAARPAAEAFERVIFQEHLSLISTAASAVVAGVPAILPELSGSEFVVTPMIADHGVAGLLVAARPRALPAWSDEEVEFLRAAGDIAAIAIQHAALRAQLRVISAAAAEINSPLSLQGLLRRLIEAAMSVTRSTLGVAGLVEGDEMVCREICRDGVWSSIDARFGRNEGLPGWCWENRAPSVANDAPNDPRAARRQMEQDGIRSALTVPIVNRDGGVVGFFELRNKAAGLPYGEEDVHLASSLAHHAALALEARKG